MARFGVLALALLFVSQCSAEGLFQEGQEYQYSYLAYTTTGVRNPSPYSSGFGIQGNLVIQMKTGSAVVRLTDVKAAMHNGQDSSAASAKFIKKNELSVLEKPFKISYTNGKVSGFDADPSDAEWSINVKKGIATALQVDDSVNRVQKVYSKISEDTITGVCDTSYSFGAGENGRMVLIKQRTASECTNFPRIGLNTFGATNCAGKLQDEVLATTQAYYEFSRSSQTLKAHIIASLGYQILQWHPPAGEPFYNLANQTMLLKTAGPIGRPIKAEGITKHYSNLRYTVKRPIPSTAELDLAREEDFFHPEEPKPQPVLIEMAKKALESMHLMIDTPALEESSMHNPAIMGAINVISGLSLDSLKQVYASFGDDEVNRSFFIQLLPFCGSNPAALMIKSLLLDGKLTDNQARRAIAFLPFYLRLPNEKLLSEYEVLLKENPKITSKRLRAAIALSFGHMVGVTCSNKNRPCNPDTINKYSRMAVEAGKAAKTHQERMLALLTLSNSKLSGAIEQLIPLTKSGAVSHALRPHIILALVPLAHTDRNKFMSAIMPIILNKTESTEIRIAAIGTLFDAQPTFLDLQQLTAGMIWERNPEVSNFVVTTFKNHVNTKNPCIAPMSNNLQLLLRRIAHIKTSHYRSSNRVFDYRDAKYGFGGGLQLITVYSGESRAPVVLAGRVNYYVSNWGYVPLEVFIRLEGVEDTFVKLFRGLDTKDFKLDVLKDLLQKTMKIAPRRQAPMKMEVVLRSQGYNLLYRHMDESDLVGLMSNQRIGEMISQGVEALRNTVLLGGMHASWRSNDIGIPVGVGLANPGLSKSELAYESVSEDGKFGRSFKADVDLTLQVANYMVAYNPMGASQGIVKIRGSRLHLPTNAMFSVSPVTKEFELKINTPSKDHPRSILFSSKTLAVVWGKDSKKAEDFMKESCPDCITRSLVTKGEQFRKSKVIRDKDNERLGLESHIEVVDCENYKGKHSTGRVLFDSFKPSEINSHGSVPGWLLMGFMQLRNYFYYYPPTGSCTLKAMVHRADENPSTAMELRLSADNTVPSGKKASPGKTFTNIKGTMTMLGEIERKWKIDVSVEKEPMDVKSSVNVKIARQPVAALGITSRAVCLNVKTTWAPLPESDILETPSAIEPSVQRDWAFAWGEAPTNECPKAGAKGVSSFTINVLGNITQEQRDAASKRDSYPYSQCDADRVAAGRTGTGFPMTEACYQAALQYSTPRNYEMDIRYDQLSDRGMKALYRFDTGLKAALIAYWDMHAPHEVVPAKKNPNSGHIELKLNFGEDDVDIHVHTDTLHSHFENVEALESLDVILRNARFGIRQRAAVKSGLLGICDVAPKAIVTFDNVTLDYQLPKCWTLASADCSENPRYAVFVRKSDKMLPLAAKIYVGGHSLEMNPTDSGVEFKANDKVVKVESNKPYVLSDKDNVMQFLTVTKMGSRYIIQAPLLKLTFRYTGDDITNLIPATHRSQHCGLCGDYNGQIAQELVGPSGCSHATVNDMAKAYVLKDKTCKEKVESPACADSQSALPMKRSAGIVEFFDQFNVAN